jgi:hypothetical protein
MEAGGMNNAEEILHALDSELDSAVELTLYGRAALQLGFANPPSEYGLSRDVDAVLWIGQAEDLLEHSNFWDAVDTVNRRFAGRELYISHFFEETQVTLLPDWRENRVPIGGTWNHLRLYRLSDKDLFLTKLMRDDPIDIADARFIVANANLSRQDLLDAIRHARIPDAEEIREQFELCSKRFLK